jgi:hypothetical protein
MWQSYGGSSPYERLLIGRSSNPLASGTGLAIAVILILSGRKDFLPVEPQSDLSFLFLLGAPRSA